MVLSQEEARLLNQNFIGTEHLLLGLIHERDGLAAQALEHLGITLEAARARVEETMAPPPPAGGGGPPPFSPRAKRVLELSLREALQLGHNYVGPEHILLGLIREGRGAGARVLVDLGAGLQHTREDVLALSSGAATPPPPATTTPTPTTSASTTVGPPTTTPSSTPVTPSTAVTSSATTAPSPPVPWPPPVTPSATSPAVPTSDAAATSGPVLSIEEERQLGETVVKGRWAEQTLRTSPPSAPGEREALVRAVGEGDEAQARLVEGTVPHLYDVVQLRARRDGGQVDQLLAIGSTGLVTAARHYDPSRGLRFAVYAGWWIHRALDERLADPLTLESVEVGDRSCSFCGRHRTEVAVMVAGHGQAICEECADIFVLQLLGGLDQGQPGLYATPTETVVRCAHCAEPLTDRVGIRRLPIQGDDEHDLLAVFCGSCGTLISATPAPAATPER